MKIPRNETVKVTFFSTDGQRHIITKNENTGRYIIYRKIGHQDYEKLGTGINPISLEEKYIPKPNISDDQ